MGVDPGKTGAIVFMSGDTRQILEMMRMPLVKKSRVLDAKRIYELILKYKPSLLIQEFVRSRPENGVKQAFEFGRCAEICVCLARALDVPVVEVPPQEWLKNVPKYKPGAGKEHIVKQAQKMFGVTFKFKADWGMADALFLTDYGIRVLA